MYGYIFYISEFKKFKIFVIVNINNYIKINFEVHIFLNIYFYNDLKLYGRYLNAYCIFNVKRSSKNISNLSLRQIKLV